MSDVSARHYEDRARIICAMASPTRLMLVDELARDEQRRGKMVYYHIRNPLAKRFVEFAECCLRRAAEE